MVNRSTDGFGFLKLVAGLSMGRLSITVIRKGRERNPPITRFYLEVLNKSGITFWRLEGALHFA
jgi:hypothetical protein